MSKHSAICADDELVRVVLRCAIICLCMPTCSCLVSRWDTPRCFSAASWCCFSFSVIRCQKHALILCFSELFECMKIKECYPFPPLFARRCCGVYGQPSLVANARHATRCEVYERPSLMRCVLCCGMCCDVCCEVCERTSLVRCVLLVVRKFFSA